MSAELVGDSPSTTRPTPLPCLQSPTAACLHACERAHVACQTGALVSPRWQSVAALCCFLPTAQLTCRHRQVSSARKSPPTVVRVCSRIAFMQFRCFQLAVYTLPFALAPHSFTRIGAHAKHRRECIALRLKSVAQRAANEHRC